MQTLQSLLNEAQFMASESYSVATYATEEITAFEELQKGLRQYHTPTFVQPQEWLRKASAK